MYGTFSTEALEKGARIDLGLTWRPGEWDEYIFLSPFREALSPFREAADFADGAQLTREDAMEFEHQEGLLRGDNFAEQRDDYDLVDRENANYILLVEGDFLTSVPVRPATGRKRTEDREAALDLSLEYVNR